MLTNPPMIPTNLLPEDIIGSRNMDIFKNHCSEYKRLVGEGKSPKENPQMAATLKHLRDNGYMVGDNDRHGNITFRVIVKSKIQQLFEGPELEELKKMSEEEVRAKARNGYHNIAPDDKQWQRITKADIQEANRFF